MSGSETSAAVWERDHVEQESHVELESVRMEKAVARVRFEGLDDEGETSASEAGSSGGEEETGEARELVMRQNRKGKKSGGFQSMGKAIVSLWQTHAALTGGTDV